MHQWQISSGSIESNHVCHLALASYWKHTTHVPRCVFWYRWNNLLWRWNVFCWVFSYLTPPVYPGFLFTCIIVALTFDRVHCRRKEENCTSTQDINQRGCRPSAAVSSMACMLNPLCRDLLSLLKLSVIIQWPSISFFKIVIVFLLLWQKNGKIIPSPPRLVHWVYPQSLQMPSHTSVDLQTWV